MSADVEPLEPDEVLAIPVDAAEGLVLAIGRDLREGGSPVPKSLMRAALDKGGLVGGIYASKSLLDGSLVRLAPETARQLKQGAVYVKDKQGWALGTLRNSSGGTFKGAVRFAPGAANPVAAGLILQTMALQHQLGQVQQALETVNAKLDLLLEGQQYAVLSELASVARQLDELRTKAAGGHELSAVDENKIRDYEDTCLARAHEAQLWLAHLRSLLDAESLALRAHHDQLEQLLDKHVAFWVRIAVLSQLSLAQARTLRLYRASTSEPEEWVRSLAEQVQVDLDDIVGGLVTLVHDFDAYLRRSDIASGLAELSLKKKATVRRLRRELWRTHEALRESLQEVLAAVPAATGPREVQLPPALRRREFEPHPIRDNLGEAQRAAARGLRGAAESAGDRTLRGVDRLARRMQEWRDEPDEDGSRSGPASE